MLIQGEPMLARKSRSLNRSTLIGASMVTFLAMGCASTPESQAPDSAPSESVAEQTAEPVAEPLVATPAMSAQQPQEQESAVPIRESAPTRYVVAKGDTLWDISSKFLEEPWFWPELWSANPQIQNPHLIFPGDVITLFYVGGKPYLQVTGGPRISVRPDAKGSKLSPRIRTEDLDSRDSVLPVQAIQQFIFRPRVVTQKQLEESPYIVGAHDNRLIFGARDEVYVRNLEPSSQNGRYSVYRAGKPIHDPKTNELLGYQAIPVGDANIVKSGDPATVQLTRTVREALIGDRLLPHDSTDEERNFFPHPPAKDVDGTVVSLHDALTQIGSLQVAVVNLGLRDGLEKGHVLAVHEAGNVVYDPFAKKLRKRKITLPDKKTGVMMVFRTFDKISYALVMDATRPIHIGDSVRNP